MTVYFIGAGPGAADLITVRGLKLIQESPVCLYAGSLVPEEIVKAAPEGARVIDTAPMHLDEIMEEIKAANAKGQDVARVHSGDPCLYGAIAEQIRRLKELDIPFTVTPGVSAYAGMAAELESELTLAGVSQSIVLTRTAVRASSMPEGETLENFAKTGATLAVHLSINNLAKVVKELKPHYGEDCPVVVGYRVTWPDQQFVHGTLADIRDKVKPLGITRTALILVGRVLSQDNFADSHLYHADHTHVLRPAADGSVD